VQISPQKISDLCHKVGLSDQVVKQNSLKVQVLEFPAGEVLFKPGVNCQGFLILLSGAIKTVLTSRSGRDVTLYRMQSGETCILTTSALLTNQPYYAQGIAETDIAAIAISIADFHRAIKHSSVFAEYVLRDYATRVSSIINLVDKMSTRDVMHTVIGYLINNAVNNDCGLLEVRATQRHIAKEIGSAREVVGRKLSELEERGLLQRKRGLVSIKDLQALTAAGN